MYGMENNVGQVDGGSGGGRRGRGEQRHEVFISYAAEDGDFMRKVARGLEAAGLRCWADPKQQQQQQQQQQEQSSSGDAPVAFQRKEVAQAVQACLAIVFIVSPGSIKSKECVEEVTFAYDEGKQVFPVVLDGRFEKHLDAGLDMLIKRFQWTIFDGKPFDDALKRLLLGLTKFVRRAAEHHGQGDFGVNAAGTRDDDDGRTAALNIAAGGSAGGVEEGCMSKGGGLAMTLAPKDVFISWAHKDSDFVKEHLWPDLEKNNVDCWIDVLQLEAGTFWRTKIGEAIKGCKFLIVVLSPTSVTSRYVQEEVQFAYDCNKSIVPVHYADASKELEEDAGLAMLLRSFPAVDFTRAARSIADGQGPQLDERQAKEYAKGMRELVGLIREGPSVTRRRSQLGFTVDMGGAASGSGEVKARARSASSRPGSAKATGGAKGSTSSLSTPKTRGKRSGSASSRGSRGSPSTARADEREQRITDRKAAEARRAQQEAERLKAEAARRRAEAEAAEALADLREAERKLEAAKQRASGANIKRLAEEAEACERRVKEAKQAQRASSSDAFYVEFASPKAKRRAPHLAATKNANAGGSKGGTPKATPKAARTNAVGGGRVGGTASARSGSAKSTRSSDGGVAPPRKSKASPRSSIPGLSSRRASENANDLNADDDDDDGNAAGIGGNPGGVAAGDARSNARAAAEAAERLALQAAREHAKSAAMLRDAQAAADAARRQLELEEGADALRSGAPADEGGADRAVKASPKREAPADKPVQGAKKGTNAPQDPVTGGKNDETKSKSCVVM